MQLMTHLAGLTTFEANGSIERKEISGVMHKQLLTAVMRRLRRPAQTLEGYEQQELVDVIFQKTVNYVPDQDWPEIAGASSVLDFGGGCGLHYKQARSSRVRWAVVDTPMMVARAAELATDRLKFFSDIAAAAGWLGAPIDVMHSGGALQYAPDPGQTLSALCGLRATRMIWDRLALSKGGIEREVQSSYLSDNGPGRVALPEEKTVQYLRTKLPEAEFLKAHANYDLTARGDDWFRFHIR